MRTWEAEYFLPLVQVLEDRGNLKVLTWESCIERIAAADQHAAEELERFYERCLSFMGAAI